MLEEISAATTLNDFQPLQKIGEGSYSSVYKVRRVIDNKLYALKKVHLDLRQVKMNILNEKQKNNALNQIRILASIQSPYILSYKDAFFDGKYNLLCIVMQWANGGDVQKLIHQHIDKQTSQKSLFPEEQIWKAASHILSGLTLLHQKGILHRDLKTANIFLSDGKYKIGDMNVSKVQSQQQLAYTQTGTPYYASPQIWKDQPYCSKSDIWSFGCLIYQMCTFNPPFKGKDIESLYKHIKKGKYQKIPQIYSSQLQQLISICLSKDSKKRPSAQQLLYKSQLIIKKCQQYKIVINNSKSTCNLLQTIKFVTNTQQINSFLPQSKYIKNPHNKRSTQQTFQKSSSGELSTGKYNKKIKVQKKYSKIINIQRLHDKITTKVDKKLILSAHDQQSTFIDQNTISRIRSLKKTEFRQKSMNSQSDKKEQNSFIEKTPFYPKIAKIRNLTTQRKQVTQESARHNGLEVIIELNQKCESNRAKLKKVNSVQYKSGIKKQSKIMNKKEDSTILNPLQHVKSLFQDTKSHASLLRQDYAFDNHLRKMSKKMIRKISSNPFLHVKPSEEYKVNRIEQKKQSYLKRQNKSNKYKKYN